MPSPRSRVSTSSSIVALRLVVCCLALLSFEPANGQPPLTDDEAAELAQAASAVDEIPEFTPPDPAVEQLLREAERSPTALGTAIASLARSGDWEDVDRLLTDAAGRSLDKEAQAVVAETLGPALTVQIASEPSISDQARQFLETVNQAAADQLRDPARLSDAIDTVGAASVDERLAAARTLLRGGEASIPPLVTRIVNEPDASQRDDWLRILLRLGEGGAQGLHQLALYGNAGQRAGALSALARIDTTEALPLLAAALHAPSASEAELQVARSVLGSTLSELPDRSATESLLVRELERAERTTDQAVGTREPITLWYVDQDRESIRPVQTDTLVAAHRRAYDAAALLMRIGPPSSKQLRQALLADLNYRMLVDPEWGSKEQLGAARQRFRLNAATIRESLSRALRQRDPLAAIAILRLIDDRLYAPQLLQSSGSDTSPLVRATYAPEPRLRYEAAAAIARLNPSRSYPGLSETMRTLDEMRALGDLPVALVVETRPEVSQQLEQLLSDLGYEVRLVSSVAGLEQAVHEGGDLSFILAKTQLADYPPIELVDRIRRLPRGRTVPIAFYGDDEPWLGRDRWPGLLVTLGLPATEAGLRPLFSAIDETRLLPPLSGADRSIYREIASRYRAAMEHDAAMINDSESGGDNSDRGDIDARAGGP